MESHEVFPSQDNLDYNWYRVSRGNYQAVFIRLILCLLDQILTYQINDLYIVLSYCKDNFLGWQWGM